MVFLYGILYITIHCGKFLDYNHLLLLLLDKAKAFRLVKKNVECKSSDEYIGKYDAISKCVKACKARVGQCQFFIYGKKNEAAAGQCWWEKTTTKPKHCNEGWEDDKKYNFYEVSGTFTSINILDII